MELELDVTESSATDTAKKVDAFVRECVASQMDSKVTFN